MIRWMKTGDIGHMTEDGTVFISDRLKELIKVKQFKLIKLIKLIKVKQFKADQGEATPPLHRLHPPPGERVASRTSGARRLSSQFTRGKIYYH